MNLALAIAGLGCFLLAFGHTTIGLRWVLPNLTNGSLPSTPPNAPHTFRPWRIHELARDLRLEDVWALPTPGGPDDVSGRPRRWGSAGGVSSRRPRQEEEMAMAEVAISTEGLVKRYGRNRGLAGLDLEVRQGEVFGFLGPNGAGKTTTIRLLVDLIRPTAGRASVLGLDPRRDGVALRRRIGYLAGDFIVDGRQSGRELLRFLGNLRGGVPQARIEELAGRLDLDLSRKIKALSKGNRQKLGIVQAFMHTPELLILDEPTSGLDPFLQQEFAAMAREATDAGQTILMSSHVMSEVQQTADRVGIIREGRLVTVERVETLRERAVRKVELHFEAPVPAEEFAALPGVTDLRVDGTLVRCRLAGSPDALVKAAARHSVVDLLSEEPDLEELFFDSYRNHREEPSHAA